MRKSRKNIELIHSKLKLIKRGSKTRKKTAKYLGTSEKTVGKWYKEFLVNGTISLKTHKPVNKIPATIVKEIMAGKNQFTFVEI